MERTEYEFTRDEIVVVATAALNNWDFGVEPEYSEQMQLSLRDIVDGSDDVGSDEDYPAVHKSTLGREDALVEWLDLYARSH